LRQKAGKERLIGLGELRHPDPQLLTETNFAVLVNKGIDHGK
jgi:hypothetical protein